MHSLTYRKAIKHAEALKRLGWKKVILDGEATDLPWKHVTEVSPRGTHRLGIVTTVWFTAVDPVTRLKFSWFFDLEPHSANGRGTYNIRVAEASTVLSKLPSKAKKRFASYLVSCAVEIRKKANEVQFIYQGQILAAQALEALAAKPE